jgi:DNA-binding SARP family transcriptional activator
VKTQASPYLEAPGPYLAAVSSQVPVWTEKLRRPDPAGLPRPRLERPLLLDAHTVLDLVVAPPGAGKTTLLGRVAAAAPVPVAWYRVSSDDASEASFSAHLARALGDALARSLPASSITELLELLHTADVPPVLAVLDDLHEVLGAPAERALGRFLELRPPTIRVLVGSRRPPEVNVPRLRVSGALREITGEDLRFRSWEVEELFVAVFGEPLPPETAATLTRRLGGWAAGLQLFHLATSGRGIADRARAVAELGGRSRLIRGYLARNVIDELPPDRRDFLLRTCTLGVLTGELCDALLDTTGSARVLDELERRQLFTSSEDDGRTFRYHEVLRTHLELLLAEEYGAAGARSWYTRSAALLEDAGETLAAIRAHARAEDWAAVARLVQQHDPAAGGNTDLLVPAALLDSDPWLALTHARRRLRSGAVADAAAAFRHAAELLDDEVFQSRRRVDRYLAEVWLPGADRMPAPRTPEITALAEHWTIRLRDATRGRLPAGPTGHPLLDAVSALLAGDLAATGQALAALPPDHDPAVQVLAALLDAAVQVLSARCPDPVALFGRIGLQADAVALPWASRLCRGFAEAWLVTAGPADEWRLQSCRDLAAECDRTGDPWGAALLDLAAGIAAVAAHSPLAADLLSSAASRFTALTAELPALWAQALALADAGRQGRPGDAGPVVDQAARWGIGGILALVRPVPAVARPEAPATPGPPTTVVPAGPPVRVRCLGGFGLEIGGTALDLAPLRPLARTVLRMLAVHPDGVHRERLVDALWPDAELAVGTRRLQVAVSSIRQLLDTAGLPGAVPRDGEVYRLTLPPGSSVDVLDFEADLRAADRADRTGDRPTALAARETAVSGYGGDLLPEEGSAEWVLADRDRLRAAAAQAASRVAEDHPEQQAVIRAARRSVEIDPFQDRPWVLLADAFESVGDRSAAARARRDHERILQELV